MLLGLGCLVVNTEQPRAVVYVNVHSLFVLMDFGQG
jgi:hypothetical protein